MLGPAHPFTDKKDFAFIRSRGTLYGSGDARKAAADAAAGFADGWSVVVNMLHMKAVSEAEAERAAKVSTNAAWAEWHRNRSSSDGA